MYTRYPNGEQVLKAIPTGPHCSNYKAEEVIIHCAHIIGNNVNNITPVVFRTDALSVLQALTNDKLSELEQTLLVSIPSKATIKTLLQCTRGSLLMVEFLAMNKLTD